MKSPIVTKTHCKSTCLYNAPSMDTVESNVATKNPDDFVPA